MSKILKIALLMAIVAVAMSQTTTEEPGSGDDRFGIGNSGKSGKGGKSGKSEKGGHGGVGGGFGGSKSEKGGGSYKTGKSEKGGFSGGSKSEKGGHSYGKSEKGGHTYGKSKKGSSMMVGEQMKEFNTQSVIAVVGGVALVAGLGFFAYRRSQAKTQYEMVEITNEKDAVVLDVDASTDKTPLLQ